MIAIVKTISTAIKNGIRQIKVTRYGKDDVQEVRECGPFGIDSNVPKGFVAIYAQTSAKDAPVIVGYFNKNQLAEVGGTRLYSTNASGVVQFALYMRADGTAEIGGTGDFLVKYTALNQAMTDLETFLNQQLALISAGISAGGGSYTPGTASIDILGAKAEKLKTAS